MLAKAKGGAIPWRCWIFVEPVKMRSQTTIYENTIFSNLVEYVQLHQIFVYGRSLCFVWDLRELGAPSKVLMRNGDTCSPINLAKNLDFGSRGSDGAIFILNIITRIANKLLIIFPLHFGLIAFRFHYGRTLKPTISWFSNFGTCPWLRKPVLFIFGNTRYLQII